MNRRKSCPIIPATRTAFTTFKSGYRKHWRRKKHTTKATSHRYTGVENSSAVGGFAPRKRSCRRPSQRESIMSMGGLGGGGFFGSGGGMGGNYGPSGPYGAWPSCGCSSLFIILAG